MNNSKSQVTHEQEGNTKAIVFSTPFSPQYGKIINIVKKYLPMLHTDDTMSQVLEHPVKFVARRAGTIRNIFSPSLFQVAIKEVILG